MKFVNSVNFLKFVPLGLNLGCVKFDEQLLASFWLAWTILFVTDS